MEVLIDTFMILGLMITVFLISVSIKNRDIVYEEDGEEIYWFEQDDFEIVGKR